jgi:hypothetical protein
VEKLSALVVESACRLHVEAGPGLLINFGAASFKQGIKRTVNNHRDFAPSRLRVNQILQQDNDSGEP